MKLLFKGQVKKLAIISLIILLLLCAFLGGCRLLGIYSTADGALSDWINRKGSVFKGSELLHSQEIDTTSGKTTVFLLEYRNDALLVQAKQVACGWKICKYDVVSCRFPYDCPPNKPLFVGYSYLGETPSSSVLCYGKNVSKERITTIVASRTQDGTNKEILFSLGQDSYYISVTYGCYFFEILSEDVLRNGEIEFEAQLEGGKRMRVYP